MKHIKAINQKATRIEQFARSQLANAHGDATGNATGEIGSSGGQTGRVPDENDVVALESRPQGPHIPLGCSLVFSPGWEVDSTGGTAGLCQPVERDLFDCYNGCFWPVQVPDHLNHAADWTSKCATAQQDWRKLDLIFP
ncbi:MAG TPA: quinohemoprotein amine dehydrogenase [Gemmatimonadetes bacterium]|nr:quinohemoprotein amine dehydrogenase [Gemmatimonadota bacterium]